MVLGDLYLVLRPRTVIAWELSSLRVACKWHGCPFVCPFNVGPSKRPTRRGVILKGCEASKFYPVILWRVKAAFRHPNLNKRTLIWLELYSYKFLLDPITERYENWAVKFTWIDWRDYENFNSFNGNFSILKTSAHRYEAMPSFYNFLRIRRFIQLVGRRDF